MHPTMAATAVPTVRLLEGRTLEPFEVVVTGSYKETTQSDEDVDEAGETVLLTGSGRPSVRGIDRATGNLTQRPRHGTR
jgi:hypothetical protein